MSDKPIFGGLTGEQLVERCAERATIAIRDAAVTRRGVVPSDDAMVIARTAARSGAVKMLQELQNIGMIAPPEGWTP